MLEKGEGWGGTAWMVDREDRMVVVGGVRFCSPRIAENVLEGLIQRDQMHDTVLLDGSDEG